MKDRNYGIDCYRVLMLFWVIVSHLWFINGEVPIRNIYIYSLITLGGEIGVTGFFVLSGWSIYFAIERMDGWWEYIKRRVIRIAPEYYVSLIIVLFLSDGAAYFSKYWIKSVLATLVFLQNSTPDLVAINGVLWTMSITVKFYIISPILYKLICKNRIIFVMTSCIFTVVLKYLALHCGTNYITDNAFYLSRGTILTDLDNFVFGMLVASMMKLQSVKGISSRICNVMIIICLVGVVSYGVVGIRYGIHKDNFSGYTWHTVIAAILSLLLFFCGQKRMRDNKSIVKRVVSYLAKHQYGVYVFHLIVIEKLVRNSELIQVITKKNYYLAQLVLFILSVGVGLVMSNIINKTTILGIRHDLA